MRGDIIRTALENIGVTGASGSSLIEAFLISGRNPAAVRRNFVKFERQRAAAEGSRREMQKYYGLLYRLKRHGLITEQKKKNKVLLWLTKKGKEKLELLKKKAGFPQAAYPVKSSETFVIVAFDIPEKEKYKRVWFRSVLKALGMRMIQKSVWMGKVKILKILIGDLRRLRMLDFVHFFEVSKLGSFSE